MRVDTPARSSNQLLKTTGVVALILVFLGGIVGIALVVRSSQLAKPLSCSEMAQAAAVDGDALPEVVLVVGLGGNGAPVADEVSGFIKQQLARTDPTSRTIAKIVLVNGDHTYMPTGSDADCLGHDLLVSPATSDLKSYTHASNDAKDDVAKSLIKQYADAVNHVSTTVAALVRKAPRPASGDAGAFDVWSYASRVPTKAQLGVLDTFAVGGDNCLTLKDPATLATTGQTLIGSRVERCVAHGQVRRAAASSITLVAASAVGLTGSQTNAQAAVIRALCSYATRTGCANQL